MITLQKTDYQQMEQAAADAGVTLPIEQTDVWARFQADIPGRTPWGVYMIQRDGETVAFIAFIDMETHGYHYLRSMHGPAWIVKPDEALEREAIDAIAAEVHRADRHVAFIRIDTWFTDGTVPVLSTVPYDQTVVIDVTGGDDAILSRMKRRGRRDESQLTCEPIGCHSVLRPLGSPPGSGVEGSGHHVKASRPSTRRSQARRCRSARRRRPVDS